MANMDDTPISPEELSNFEFINHNETDFEAFREFSKNLNDRYERGAKAREAEARKRDLTNWIESVPARFRGASFKKLDEELRNEIIKDFKAKQKGYFIAGPHGSGKTFTAYAIARKLVAGGVVRPSQIKVISESQLLKLSTGGFETREELDDLTNPHYKLYIFDSLGTKDFFEAKRELPALSHFIESVYNSNAFFIATSYQSLEFYSELLSDSAAVKLKDIVRGGMLFTGDPLDENEDTESSSKKNSNKNPYGWSK